MHQVDVSELRQYALDNGVRLEGDLGDDVDAWRDLVMTHFVEPHLGREGPVFVYEYPASQAALAQVRHGENPVALRFELYFKGIELANGYQELTDCVEQEQRFCRQNDKRRDLHMPEVPIDRHLLSALSENMPTVSGAALGLDRLLMLLANSPSIKEVLSFDFQNA
jgi:lysyl-tRNA synthetase class 2